MVLLLLNSLGQTWEKFVFELHLSKHVDLIQAFVKSQIQIRKIQKHSRKNKYVFDPIPGHSITIKVSILQLYNLKCVLPVCVLITFSIIIMT